MKDELEHSRHEPSSKNSEAGGHGHDMHDHETHDHSTHGHDMHDPAMDDHTMHENSTHGDAVPEKTRVVEPAGHAQEQHAGHAAAMGAKGDAEHTPPRAPPPPRHPPPNHTISCIVCFVVRCP